MKRHIKAEKVKVAMSNEEPKITEMKEVVNEMRKTFGSQIRWVGVKKEKLLENIRREILYYEENDIPKEVQTFFSKVSKKNKELRFIQNGGPGTIKNGIADRNSVGFSIHIGYFEAEFERTEIEKKFARTKECQELIGKNPDAHFMVFA